MSIKTLIAIALLIWPMASLFSAEKGSPTLLIMGGISSGSETVNYGPINNILGLYSATDQSIKGISDNYMLGITGALINDRGMIHISTMLSPGKQELYGGSTVSFYRLSNAVKIGPRLLSCRQSIIFPYLGIGLESLLIKTDLKYSPPPWRKDVFFVGKNDYSIYDVAFLYGLAYDLPISVREKNWPLPFDVVIGIDARGMISKPHRRWYVNGKPDSNIYAPEYHLNDFVVKVHLDIGLTKGK